VRADRPTEHRAQFTVEVPDVATPSVDLVLPSWVPGSYWIQDPSRAFRDVVAWTHGRERPLRIDRVAKDRWRVAADGATAIEVGYSVYGHQMITEALDVTPDHLFLNAAFCLPYVDGRKDEAHELRLHLPAGWKVYAELDEVASAPPTLRAADYDALVDAPIDCGRPVELGITAAGVPHRIVLCGPGGNYEVHRLEDDLRRIAEATIRLFGGSPLRRYTFFVHLNDVSDGALEHAASVSAVVPRTTFRPESAYRWFLLVSAHEYVHLYNVKRIHPAVLGPFDYTREAYTRLLWAMEGTTDYYAHLILRRSGLLPPAKSLEELAKLIHTYRRVPGRAHMSLELASISTWVDFYRPYEETVNQSVSYYLKGALVSLCLDLELRHRTENAHSLDEVFRHLYTEYGLPGRGLGEDELPGVIAKVTGIDVGPFFDRYIRGTDEIDFAPFLRYAGLVLSEKTKPREPGDDEPAGYLGIDYENRDGHVRIRQVVDGGPARRDGLSPGDEIIALDGVRTLHDGFGKALERLPAGQSAVFTVFRRGFLTTVPVTLGTPPPEGYRIAPAADATPLERTIYESWFEATWEPPKPPVPPPA